MHILQHKVHSLPLGLVLGLLIWYSPAAYAQGVNSTSANETGLYYYAIDTVVKKIKSETEVSKLWINSKVITFDEFPAMIDSVSANYYTFDEPIKSTKKLGEQDIYLNILPLTIVKNEISIVIWAYRKYGKRLVVYDLVGYKVQYEYDCATQRYWLVDIEH